MGPGTAPATDGVGPASGAAPGTTPTTLTVRSVHRPTRDSVHIVLDPPGPAIDHLPGQHLTVVAEVDGTTLARSYSLTSVPGLDDALAVVVKRTPGGRLSNALNDRVRAGSTLAVLPPAGRFTLEPDPGQRRHVVLFAAGSGITPVYAIARAVLHREPLSRVSLVYANVGRDDIIFRDELDRLVERHPGRLDLTHLLERADGVPAALTGRLTPDRARSLVLASVPEPAAAHCFVCGPEPFMDAAVAALRGLGVPDDRVRVERFVPPAAPAGDAALHRVRVVGPGGAVDLVVPADRALLDAAGSAGVAIPYSCRVGDCGTCRTRLLRGTVQMAAVDGLTEEEEADGWILTCVARPTGDVELAVP